jgi:hypothetical protein
MKGVDLHVRPIRHRLEERVNARTDDPEQSFRSISNTCSERSRTGIPGQSEQSQTFCG